MFNNKVDKHQHQPGKEYSSRDGQIRGQDTKRYCHPCGSLIARREAAEHSSLAFKVGPLVAEIRAFRDLAATARSVTEMTVQEDELDPDGAKFAYLLGRLFEAFRESVIEAECTPHLWNTICRLTGDNLAKAEPEIRRDIKKAHKLPKPEGLPWSPTKSTGS
jgi:hypothetical protein